MDVGHVGRPRSFEQHNWAVWVLSEDRGLQKQSTIGQRHRKIRVRLPLDKNGLINQIVTSWESDHLHVKAPTLAHEIDKCGTPF